MGDENKVWCWSFVQNARKIPQNAKHIIWSESMDYLPGSASIWYIMRTGSLISNLSSWYFIPLTLAYPIPAMAISLQLSRISSGAAFFSPELKVFPCRETVSSVRCAARESSSSTVAVDADFDTKDFRKNLTRRPNYNRKGFGRKEETLEQIKREYASKF